MGEKLPTFLRSCENVELVWDLTLAWGKGHQCTAYSPAMNIVSSICLREIREIPEFTREGSRIFCRGQFYIQRRGPEFFYPHGRGWYIFDPHGRALGIFS